jgi:hypothetical protein
MPNQQRTVSDLLAEHTDTQRIRLGGVEFHMNSAKYEQTSERAVVTVQTAGGYSRYDCSPTPREYVITGCTGLTGVYGSGGVQELRQFEPQPGQPDRLWSLEFAGEFRGRRYVKETAGTIS